MTIIDTTLSAHVYNPIIDHLRTSTSNYLEIGVFNGVGLARVAKENPNTLCEAVDPFIEDGNTIGASHTKTGDHMSAQQASALAVTKDCKNVNINIMTSHKYFDSLTDEKIATLNIGTVLIDGDHHYEFVVNDYKLAMTVIGNKAGLIVFDDLGIAEVSQAIEQFCIDYADRIDREELIFGVAKSIFIKEKI